MAMHNWDMQGSVRG